MSNKPRKHMLFGLELDESSRVKPIPPPKKFDSKAAIELQARIEAEITQNNAACQRQAKRIFGKPEDKK